MSTDPEENVEQVVNIQEIKNEARKAAFLRRKQAFENLRYDLKDDLLAATTGYEVIACYMAMRTEINPLEAMAALVDAGRKVVVPVILGKARPLAFHEWRPEIEMIEGEFGALIPKHSHALDPDFVLAPMVAYDEKGTRLGYGGGFYDRSLAQLRRDKNVPYIGLAFEAQLAAEDLPREDTDIPLDGIITENGFRGF